MSTLCILLPICFCSCDSGGDCECLCTAIAAYAEECNRRGVYIRWRSQELCRMLKLYTSATSGLCWLDTAQLTVFVAFCFSSALQCEKGLVYNPCGPTCSPSCPYVQQDSYSLCSAFSCVEGCFCPPRMVLNGKTISKIFSPKGEVILDGTLECVQYINTSRYFMLKYISPKTFRLF